MTHCFKGTFHPKTMEIQFLSPRPPMMTENQVSGASQDSPT